MCAECSCVSRLVSGTLFFVTVAVLLTTLFSILDSGNLYLLVWLLVLFGAGSVFWCMNAPHARIEDYSEA